MAAGRAAQGSFDWTPTRPAPGHGPRRAILGPEDRNRWLTADEAAAYLGLPTRKALYAAVARGQVPAHRLGRRRLRFRLDELDGLLAGLRESTGVR
jgi:excisionase family DNA binding protein